MLKRLPIILFSAVFFVIFFSSAVYALPAFTPTPTGAGTLTPTPTPTPGSGIGIDTGAAPGDWGPDATVTFVGKTASRSGDFLDLTLRTYDWACVTRNAQDVCDNSNNPLVGFWALIRNIIYALLVSVVLVAAFVMIITRGKSLTITRFIPRFIMIIVFVTLSYALIQFIYQMTDIIQGFFLRFEGKLISTHDLIFIGFPYEGFTGLRRFGEQFDESAFITLLLVRLTAITYYVMTGVLLVRKIILWFFIILSPVFPLLLFFRPVRNTGKIWIGEFFRWLLYAPLFAIFLHGLVVLWKSPSGIPLAFNFVGAKAGEVVYPTAVNILIGGPGQTIFFDPNTGQSNSVNLKDTFALYVVALLMLWVVIILPFILLKIFLDAIAGISIQNNPSLKRLWDRGSAFVPGGRPPPPVTPATPPPSQGAGRALQMPFSAGQARTISNANTQSRFNTQSVQSITSIPVNAQILQLANLSVPKMRDIARFETSMTSKNASHMQEVSRMKTSLSRISNPTTVSSVTERERYSQVRQQLISEKQKGNVLASTILSASSATVSQSTQDTHNITTTLEKIAHPETIPVVSERQKFTEIKKELTESSQKGNSLASSILSTATTVSEKSTSTEQKTVLSEKMKEQLKQKKDNIIANKVLSEAGAASSSQVHTSLPAVNKVQQVSIEDYEEVRKLWVDTYQNAAPPSDLSGKTSTREEWVKKDIDKINQAITLLNSVDPVRTNEGMEMVSNILPFLMIGGFSKTEVIAYLKAKLEGAKSVLSGVNKKDEEEDTMLENKKTATTETKHLSTEAEADLPTTDVGKEKLEEIRKSGGA